MFPFQIRKHARLSVVADFRHGAVLNINFYDEPSSAILFHLSLRRDEQIAVVNRKAREHWNREIQYPFSPGLRQVQVDIQFTRTAATVVLDGQVLGRYDAFPRYSPEGRMYMRRGFPGLRKICAFDLQGTYSPASVRIKTGDKRTPLVKGLFISKQLELYSFDLGKIALQKDFAGWKAPYAKIAATGLRIPVALRALPLEFGADPDAARDTAIAVILPGRIWAQAAEAVHVEIFDGHDTKQDALTVTKDMFVQEIDALAQAGAFSRDDLAALIAIEHTRFGDLHERLSLTGRRAVFAAADRLGLRAFLQGKGDEVGGSKSPTQRAEAIGRQEDLAAIAQAATEPQLAQNPYAAVDQIAAEFAKDMRAGEEADPIATLREKLRRAELSGEQKAQLFHRLIEWFCVQDRVEDLWALWKTERLAPPKPAAETDVWLLSTQLPFLYLDGQFDAVEAAMETLATPSSGWVTTPAIGWIAQSLTKPRLKTPGKVLKVRQYNAIFYAFVRFLDLRGKVYWERTTCLQLIKGALALLSTVQTMSRNKAEYLEGVLLRCYGLSPVFWAAAERMQAENTLILPAKMQRAQAAFGEMHNLTTREGPLSASSRAQISRHLAFFNRLGCYGAQQFMRDLVGPAGLPLCGSELPDLHRCEEAGMDPPEAITRVAAFPAERDHQDPMPADLAKTLRDGIEHAYSNIASDNNLAAQSELLKLAQSLVERPDQAQLDGVVHLMQTTADERGAFVGVAMSLALVRVFLRQNRPDEAAQLVEAAESVLAAARDELEWIIAHKSAAASRLQALGMDFPNEPLVARLQAVWDAFVSDMPVPDDAQTADLYAQSNPLFDTLVCLYSCQPYLETRAVVIRDTWLSLLADLGVPYLIFVGGGGADRAGKRIGDVVYLDAPDDYEGLPQKTLAMVDWVYHNTKFAHLIKVDDDCYLDPQSYFSDLSHQRVNYFGRPLHRARGQMDRTWHMAKSRSDRGRLELDKSPEPSIYADGGSGYSLSRLAMHKLIQAAESPEGRELIQVSFMEDKLVGDLLQLNDIWVAGEDYQVAVLRQTSPGGAVVSQWENGFLPFAGGNVKLAHLDGVDRMAEVFNSRNSPWPRPFKLWPSFQDVRFGAASNTLDLISPVEKLMRLNAAPVAVVACARNEKFLIEQFLQHYRGLGVEAFLFADNGSDDGTFEYLDAQPDVALFSVDTNYNDSVYGVAWQQALMANLRQGRWSLVADIDEFLFWNTDLSGTLPDLLQSDAFAGADAARIFMLDMYPQGSLSKADFKTESPFEQAPFVDAQPFLETSLARGPYSDAELWTSGLRHRLIPGSRSELFVAQKLALLRYQPWMRLSAGLHFVSDVTLAQRELIFAHFKYNAAFRAKAQAEVARAQHFNNAEEYRKYLDLVSEGRDTVYDPSVSVRFDQCEFVRSICGGNRASGQR